MPAIRSGAADLPWKEIEDHLENVRRSILAEIRGYPPPIAACDEQFNYLLEQRERVADELSRLAAMRRQASTSGTDAEALADFIRVSACTAPESKTQLLQLLNRRRGQSG